MRAQVWLMLLLLASHLATAADIPQSYGAAKAIWEKQRNALEYQQYAIQFSQFNNHFHLDEKDGCYSLPGGPVELMLLISHPASNEFAVVEEVFADVDNQKARCFVRAYRGIRTKVPPLLPFVLQMHMG